MSLRGRALPPRLVLATGNAGKLREMRAILAPWSVVDASKTGEWVKYDKGINKKGGVIEI